MYILVYPYLKKKTHNKHSYIKAMWNSYQHRVVILTVYVTTVSVPSGILKKCYMLQLYIYFIIKDEEEFTYSNSAQSWVVYFNIATAVCSSSRICLLPNKVYVSTTTSKSKSEIRIVYWIQITWLKKLFFLNCWIPFFPSTKSSYYFSRFTAVTLKSYMHQSRTSHFDLYKFQEREKDTVG